MANNLASISEASIDYRMGCSVDYWHYPDPNTLEQDYGKALAFQPRARIRFGLEVTFGK